MIQGSPSLTFGNQTLQWKTNPFVVDVIINTFVDRGFSIAMFDYRRYIGLTQFDSLRSI